VDFAICGEGKSSPGATASTVQRQNDSYLVSLPEVELLQWLCGPTAPSVPALKVLTKRC